jgi:hypothetical protein
MNGALLLHAIAALTLVLSALSALAGEMPKDRARLVFNREWVAYSTTAMGVTGDVRLTPTAVTFDNQVVFDLRYVSELSPSQVEPYLGNIKQFSLFEFVAPHAGKIRNENFLCGAYRDTNPTLPRYLVVGLQREEELKNFYESDDQLVLLVFSSDKPPPNVMQWDKDYCGSYGYFSEVVSRPD